MSLFSAANRVLASALAAMTTVLACSCTVGPDYRTPELATPAKFSEAGDAKTDPISQPVPSEADLSRWWLQFEDPTLNWLVGQALAQNLNIQQSTARLRQARQAEIVARSAGLPHLGVNAAVARLDESSRSLTASSFFGQGAGAAAGGVAGGGAAGQSISTPDNLNLFATDFDASWEIDIFGQVRRSVEEAKANTEASVWQRRDGEVSLTAEVANAYVTLRALQVQIAIAQNEAKTQNDNFAIIQQQAKTGFVTRLNVNQQVAQVEATIAQIPQLQAQARVQIHALSVLLALPPDALDARLTSPGPLPTPPKQLPVGLPSDLLRRRPDIRRAERQLASATAAIGVQVADLYPKFSINALPAFASTSVNHLFDAQNATSFGYGTIQWPIFEGGRTRANIRSARAGADQAYLAYQQAILSALQNVEDDLARYKSDQQRILPLQKSQGAAAESLTIARQQYEVGLVTYLNILQAQATLLNAQNQLAEASAALVQDLASLYTALGGGWSSDEGRNLRKTGVSVP